MTARQFTLLNLFSFILLLGVLYLNFFYEEPNEFTPVSSNNKETASLSKNSMEQTSAAADKSN